MRTNLSRTPANRSGTGRRSECLALIFQRALLTEPDSIGGAKNRIASRVRQFGDVSPWMH